MRRNQWITLSAVATIFSVLFAYTSCNKFSANGLLNLNAACVNANEALRQVRLHPSQPASPFAEHKVVLQSAYPAYHASLKNRRNVNESDNELAAIIDLQCVRSPSRVPALAEQIINGRRMEKELNRQVFSFQPTMSAADLEKAAQADSCVIGISHNHIYRKATVNQATFNDPDIGVQAHFAALNAFTAYPYFYDDTYGIQSANTSLPDTVVAIIDSGIDYIHPDLTNQIVTQNLGNGEIGWGVDATTIGSGQLINYNPIDIATDSHGTHVSGLVAAEAGNSIGVAGVAPFRVKILAVKVFVPDNSQPDGISTNSTYIANGLTWASQNGANVVNMSLQETIQGPNTDTVLQYSVQQLVQDNIFVAVAMGNGTSTVPPGQVDGKTLTVVPAIYAANLQGMMAVASVDIQQVNNAYVLSSFSNWSSTYAEIGTFGALTSQSQTYTGLFSTLTTELNPDLPYGYLAGTSMASPLVAAAAALTIRIITDRTGTAPTAAEVETLITTGAVSNASLTNQIAGGRTLDFMQLFNAIAEAYPQTVNPNYRSTLCGN